MLTRQQLDERKRGIGASEAAIVAGKSRWKTPYRLWQEKLGLADPDPAGEPAYWGNILEDIVAREYSKRMNVGVRRKTNTLYHRKYKFIFCHLDRIVLGKNLALECKTGTKGPEWGEDGSDEIPDAYYLQVQHQMAITGHEKTDVAALLGGQGGNEFRVYRIPRSQEVIEYLIDIENGFWNLVENKTPPDPETHEDLRHRWAIGEGERIADEEIQSKVIELYEIREDISQLIKQKNALELSVKSYMQDAEILINTAGKRLATWKTQSRRSIDLQQLKEDHPDLASTYEKTSNFRVFRLKR